MRCPNDGIKLTSTSRNGVEVDICRSCHGMWIDRDELDKILERIDEHDQADKPNSWLVQVLS